MSPARKGGETAGPATYWFDLLPAGEAELRRRLEEESRGV